MMCVDALADVQPDFVGGNGDAVRLSVATSGGFEAFGPPSLLLTIDGSSSLLSDTLMVVLAVMSAERTSSPPASCESTTSDSKRPAGSDEATGVTVDTLAKLLWLVSVDGATPSVPIGSNESVVISGHDLAVASWNEPPPAATSSGTTGL
uniref:Uncharacterized protein n=1 Tax=Anopheles culicifacies TaxID=139723 RepID=A0A182MKJ4_9DIPT